MTALNLPAPSGAVTGGRADRPRVAKVYQLLGRRLGCSGKAAEHRAARAHDLLPHLIAASREMGDERWLLWWFAEADAQRLGEPLDFAAWMGVNASHHDTVEDERFVRWLASPDCEDAFVAWVRSLEAEVTAKQEVLQAARLRIVR